MTNETTVTLQGYVGADVVLREAAGIPVVSLRVACTPRRYNRRTEEWADAQTQWFTVNCWRVLATHVAESVHRGDAVVVQGRLSARTFINKVGVEVSTFEIDASVVGHDLNRGVSRFVRAQRANGGEVDSARRAEDTATGSTAAA